MKPLSQLCLLACLVVSPVMIGGVHADDLGRLFTNESERARIDALRAGAPQETSASATTERMVVNGTLQGSDGKQLVWLNGAAVNPSSANNMTLLGDGRVELNWREGTRTLKPGQGMDHSSGEVFEYHTPVPPPPSAKSVAPDVSPEASPVNSKTTAEEKAAPESAPANSPESKAKKS